MWCSASSPHVNIRDRARLTAFAPPPYDSSHVLKQFTSVDAIANPSNRATASAAASAPSNVGHGGGAVNSPSEPRFQRRVTLASASETLQAFTKVLSAWRARNIASVDSALFFCEDYLDSQTLDKVPYFVGCGGVGLFCSLLCDPVVFEGRRARSYYINVMSCLMVVLTEVIVRHNNISWYIYDCYPCVFFRLIELLGVAHLNNSALSMLEHLLSVVGPVLEIAKTKSLIELIRMDVKYVLAGLCRVLALLVIPGNALQQSCMPSRHLLYPEILYPIRRVQRVVDSNVLWLQSEKNMTDRLITLCEVRSREIRVQQGGRTTTVMSPPTIASRTGTTATTNMTNAQNAGNSAAPTAASNVQDEFMSLIARLSQLPQRGDIDVAAFQAQLAPFLAQSNATDYPLSFFMGAAATGDALGEDNGQFQSSDVSDDDEEDDEEWVTDDDAHHESDDEYVDAEGDDGREGSDAATDVPRHVNARLPVNTATTLPVQMPTETAASTSVSAAPNPSATPFVPGSEAAAHQSLPPRPPQPPVAPPPTASLAETNETAARVVQELINDEAMTENGLNTRIDLNWYYGSVDARERWRLRDLTLIPERDDTRPALLGFGSLRDESANRAFEVANRSNLNFLLDVRPRAEFLELSSNFRHQTVDSQSEVLYILNVLLSTFYFSDAWHALRRCEWLKRANKIYNTSFGIGRGAPISVDVPNAVTVPEYLRSLPRFQPPTVQNPALSPDVGTTPTGACPFSTPPAHSTTHACTPAHWPFSPFHEMLGRKKDEFAQDRSVAMLQDDDDFTDETEHQHSPDTVRKLELLRGLHSFWNAQNGFESRMLDDANMPSQAAKLCTKVAQMLASNKEDPCVEAAACSVLESYLRTFTHNARVKDDWQNKPARQVGEVVLLNLLHVRVYNATLVPTLSHSIRPLRRFENTFALLGEIFQYDLTHLRTLAQHIDGTVALDALNAPQKPVNRSDLLAFAPTHAIDPIFETPPLERQEDEPFGSVLLRRLYRYGCETSLFVSAMVLSLTPGLRTRYNYAHRPIAATLEEAVAVQEEASALSQWTSVELPTTPNGRVGDLVSGFSRRFAAVRRWSRYFTEQLTLATLPLTATTSSPTGGRTFMNGNSAAWRSAVTPLLEALMAKLSALPHRLSPEERPFPGLYSPADAALLRGERGLQTTGPPRAWRVPLFGGAAGVPDAEERTKLSELAPISKYIIGEPHKLIYSLLCSLNAETMDSTARMSVVTTTILIFLRAAHLHPDDPEDTIHTLLKDIAALAAPTYRTWRKHCRASARQHGVTTAAHSTAVSTQLRPTSAGATIATDPTDILPPASTAAPAAAVPVNAKAPTARPLPVLSTTHCTCPEAQQDPHHRCLSFVICGVCHPPSTAHHYYRHYGGCFFRHMFRLLCVWIGHYWSCQRYVDTIFFYTEVAFAEYKTIALYLLRELPLYFSAPLLDA